MLAGGRTQRFGIHQLRILSIRTSSLSRLETTNTPTGSDGLPNRFRRSLMVSGERKARGLPTRLPYC